MVFILALLTAHIHAAFHLRPRRPIARRYHPIGGDTYMSPWAGIYPSPPWHVMPRYRQLPVWPYPWHNKQRMSRIERIFRNPTSCNPRPWEWSIIDYGPTEAPVDSITSIAHERFSVLDPSLRKGHSEGDGLI